MRFKMGLNKLLFLSFSFIISPFAFAANKLILVTKNYPPFNMEEGGKIIGMSTDVMKELLKKEKSNTHLNYFLGQDLIKWV